MAKIPVPLGGAPLAPGGVLFAPWRGSSCPWRAPLAPGGALLPLTGLPLTLVGLPLPLVGHLIGIAHFCTSLTLKFSLKVQYHGKIRKMLQNDIHKVKSWI